MGGGSSIAMDTKVPEECTAEYKYDFFESSSGTKLFRQQFFPPENADQIAVVLFVHGVQEHTYRYNHVLKQFAKKGIVGVSYDQQGHGRSGSDTVRSAAPKGIDGFVDDLEQLITWVTTEFKSLPFFLWGQSFGGCVSTNLLLKRPDFFKEKGGVVLTSPFLGKDLNFVEKLTMPFSKILPSNTRAVDSVKSKDMSKDPAAQKDYEKDPLVVYKNMRVNMGMCALVGANNAQARANEIKANLLICFGDTDRCCSLKHAQMLIEKVSSQDKELKVFKGLYHTMFHEPEKQEIIDTVADFIVKRV